MAETRVTAVERPSRVESCCCIMSMVSEREESASPSSWRYRSSFLDVCRVLCVELPLDNFLRSNLALSSLKNLSFTSDDCIPSVLFCILSCESVTKFLLLDISMSDM